jgi:hypothetical protein
MEYTLIFKAALPAIMLACASLSVNAQKIDEQKLKLNVSKISNPLQQLQHLDPVTFNYNQVQYKDLKLPAGNQYGFLASNLQAQYPAMVYEASKIYNSGKNSSRVAKYDEVKSQDLIPVLVAAVKEQQAEIESLKRELMLLKERSK